MKKNTKNILKSITLTLLFFSIATTWLFVEFIWPIRIISNPDWRHSDFQGDYALHKKTRNACHKILKHRLGNHHDAFLAIESVGNKDSIPYLIRALKWQTEKHEKEVASTKTVPCTFGHCISSLEKLSGVKLGLDYEVWTKWWEQTGRHLPFDEEKRQLTPQEETK